MCCSHNQYSIACCRYAPRLPSSCHPATPTHLLLHERRLRVAALPRPRSKHARRRLQRAGQRGHDDGICPEGRAQRSDVLAQGPRLARAGCQAGRCTIKVKQAHRQHLTAGVPASLGTCPGKCCVGTGPTCRQPKSVRCASKYSKLLQQGEVGLRCSSQLASSPAQATSLSFPGLGCLEERLASSLPAGAGPCRAPGCIPSPHLYSSGLAWPACAQQSSGRQTINPLPSGHATARLCEAPAAGHIKTVWFRPARTTLWKPSPCRMKWTTCSHSWCRHESYAAYVPSIMPSMAGRQCMVCAGMQEIGSAACLPLCGAPESCGSWAWGAPRGCHQRGCGLQKPRAGRQGRHGDGSGGGGRAAGEAWLRGADWRRWAIDLVRITFNHQGRHLAHQARPPCPARPPPLPAAVRCCW